MPDGSISKEKSPVPRDALLGVLARQNEMEIQSVQSELEGMAFAQECERQLAEEQLRLAEEKREEQAKNAALTRQSAIENGATEVLEVASSLAAGALSTWMPGGYKVGVGLNGVVGFAGKFASAVLDVKSAPLRVAARIAKVMLHSQISITTHNRIKGQP